MERIENSIPDDENLVVQRKFVSLIVAGLIVLGLFVFLAGFFWGYRRASHDVQIGINKTSFADQISYAALQLEPIEQEPKSDLAVASASANIINPVLMSTIEKEPVAIEQADLVVQPNPEHFDDTGAARGYYAELIGFGGLKAAQAFVDKLTVRGYQVVIKKRVSKSGNGKTVNWYQVVTQNYTDKQKLQKILEAIKKTERLQGIKIKSI